MENNTELDNTWKREQNTTKYRSEENEQNKKSLDANRLKKKWVKSTSREYYNQIQTDK